jgi:hypothetical protein
LIVTDVSTLHPASTKTSATRRTASRLTMR